MQSILSRLSSITTTTTSTTAAVVYPITHPVLSHSLNTRSIIEYSPSLFNTAINTHSPRITLKTLSHSCYREGVSRLLHYLTLHSNYNRALSLSTSITLNNTHSLDTRDYSNLLFTTLKTTSFNTILQLISSLQHNRPSITLVNILLSSMILQQHPHTTLLVDSLEKQEYYALNSDTVSLLIQHLMDQIINVLCRAKILRNLLVT